MNTPGVDTASLSALIQGRRGATSVRRPESSAAVVGEAKATGDAGRFGLLALSSRLSRAFKDGVEATKALDALDQVDARLTELEGLVKQSAKAEPAALDAIRERIDAVVGTINRAAESVTGRGHGGRGTIEYSRGAAGPQQLPPSPFAFSNIADGTEQVRANVLLPPGGSLDVNVQVTVSAQQAGFYLSFGGATINLSAATARFVIELASNTGVQELSFASGTSTGAMRDAINSFTGATGVIATASGSGLTIKSTEYGDDQFVSVRVIDSGGINTAIATAGVYVLNATNNNAAVPTQATLFTAASNQIQDFGQDIDGIVNGWNAVGNGRSLYAVTQNLQTQFRLSGEAALSIQPFRAYTISRNATTEAADTDSPDDPLILDAEKVKGAGGSATTEIGRARNGIARIRETLVQQREAQRETLVEILQLQGTKKYGALDPSRVRALLSPGSAER